MSFKYEGPIKTAAQAASWRKRALAIGSPRLRDAAALLAPDRWRMVAARPELAKEIVDEVTMGEACGWDVQVANEGYEVRCGECDDSGIDGDTDERCFCQAGRMSAKKFHDIIASKRGRVSAS